MGLPRVPHNRLGLKRGDEEGGGISLFRHGIMGLTGISCEGMDECWMN